MRAHLAGDTEDVVFGTGGKLHTPVEETNIRKGCNRPIPTVGHHEQRIPIEGCDNVLGAKPENKVIVYGWRRRQFERGEICNDSFLDRHQFSDKMPT